jgi:hypothetical protein
MLSTDEFQGKFQQQFDAALEKGNFIDAFGKRSGFCRVTVESRKADKTLRISVLPFVDTETNQPQVCSIYLRTKDEKEAGSFVPLAEKIITQNGFHVIGAVHTEQSAATMLKNKIEYFLTTHQEEYPEVVGEPCKGIYTLGEIQPTKENPSFSIRVHLRPFSHIARSQTEHLPPDQTIALAGLPANDPPLINRLKAEIDAFMQSKGFENRLLEGKPNPQKIIPAAWIDPQNITVKPSNANDYWQIDLVKTRLEHPRTRKVKFSTNTKDAEQANAMLDATREYLIEQKERGTPVSIQSIKDHLEEKGLLFSEKVPPSAKRSDTRDVFIFPEESDIHTAKNVATIFTPALVKYYSEYMLELKIAPPRINRNDINAKSSKTLSVLLGTADKIQAQRMARTVQNFTETWLVDYFTNHPEQSFLTEPKTVSVSGKEKQIIAVKRQHDIGASDEEKARYIDGETLGAQLRPAIEMARDLTWRVEMAPVDIDDPEGKQTLIVQAVHLFDDPLKSEGAVTLHPFDKPITAQADSPITAERFRNIIIASLLNQCTPSSNEPPDPHFSVERGVTHFGKPSAKLVLKESLKDGLGLAGISVAPEQNVVAQWQREAQKQRGQQNSARVPQ